MFNNFYLIFIILLTWNAQSFANFPDDPKPCEFSDSECIVKLVNYFLKERSHEGDDSINLITIDPLSVSKIRIKQGEESPVNIDLELNDNKIIGLKDATAYKVRGFGPDLSKKHELRMKLKYFTMLSNYVINGKVLILPVKGDGTCNITMIDTDIILQFTGEAYKKDDDKTYMKVTNMKIGTDPKGGILYRFDNLFNGDKILGDNFNLFLNENWSEIYQEVKDSYNAVLAKVLESILTNVFAKYPYDEYFLSSKNDEN